jgi:hypothetical protein
MGTSRERIRVRAHERSVGNRRAAEWRALHFFFFFKQLTHRFSLSEKAGMDVSASASPSLIVTNSLHDQYAREPASGSETQRTPIKRSRTKRQGENTPGEQREQDHAPKNAR